MQIIEKVKTVASIIKAEDGKTVTVTFIKRTKDKETGKVGERRVLNGRLGVKKHLKGGVLNYTPSDYNLLTIFDMQKKAYRCISLDSVEEVVASGVTYKF